MPSYSPRGRSFAVALVFGSALIAAGGANAETEREAAGAFLPHRAVYEIGLDSTSGAIVSASGRLVFEIAGSSCDGFESRFRMVTRMETADGGSRTSDLRTTSHEAGDGAAFDFVNQNIVDGHVVEDTRGSARRDGDRVALDLARPASVPASVLPASVRFPTQHMAALVAAAREGRTLFDLDLYDGSETGDRVYRTTVAIGRERTETAPAVAGAAIDASLLVGHRRWPVEISYYDSVKSGEGVETPLYQLSFTLYDDGVGTDMRLDYGEFRLIGRLTTLEALPVATCR